MRPFVAALPLILIGLGATGQSDPAATAPTGERMTPLAVPGTTIQPLDPGLSGRPPHRAGQAVSLAISPDGARMAVLTSGYNRQAGSDGDIDPAASAEWVFFYDVTSGIPRQTQALPVPNADQGLAWSPDGAALYVSGGVDDDIHVFTVRNGDFAEDGPPIRLGHAAGLGVAEPPPGVVPPDRKGRETENKPMVAGLAIDPSGRWLLAANFENDSVTLVDLRRRAVSAERDLRPGKSDAWMAGVPGGEYPVAVAWAGNGKAYAASERDREIVALDMARPVPRIIGRLKLAGQPNALRLNRAGTRLYAAVDNSDSVVVIDTGNDRVIETIPALGPFPLLDAFRGLRGVNPNSVAISPDQSSLFVTEGGIDAVAQIALSPAARGIATAASPRSESRVAGLLPTAWYPNAAAVSRDGRRLFVINGKSPAGPNPDGCRNSTDISPGPKPCVAANQFVWQLETASVAAIPLPGAEGLAAATRQVVANIGAGDRSRRDAAEAVLAEVSRRIHHVIYVIKENRGYDQILGDLPAGNGDPRLTLFPAPITPNHHALASGFVTLDAFFDSGEVSGVGWNWSTAGRATDFTEKTVPLFYAGRGLTYDWEGSNRGIDVALDARARKAADSAIPDDPDLLPGPADVAAPDAAEKDDAHGEAGAGYLWDAALRAGLTVRNYGFFVDTSHYGANDRNRILPSRHPFADRIIQAVPAKQALAPVTDLYFRGFDQSYADFWRYQEWRREFDLYAARGDLPALSLVRLPHDHFGNFADAADGLGTVDGEMADNDLALGLLVQTVADSRFKGDTLIFVIEDDAQNGADHVDAHRSVAFIAGPYVKQGAVISEPFTTVNLLRTIEAVLKLRPLGLNDALASPMASVFDLNQTTWRYRAAIAEVLRRSALPLPAGEKRAGGGCFDTPRRTATWWEKAMRGQDFSSEDRIDSARFNQVLWLGLKDDPGRAACN